MKLLSLILTVILAKYSSQSCTSTPGVTSCKDESLTKNIPLRIEKYQNLLEFSQGQLQNVPTGSFKLLTELKILFINNNKVKNLEQGAFDGLYNLEKLSLYNNELQTIPSGVFRDLRQLKNLNLAMNQISKIANDAFAGLIILEEINLGFNRLSSIPSSLNAITSLKILNLNNNQLKLLPANSFPNLNKLEILNLADNAITEIQSKAYKGLGSLKQLNLKSNYLTKFDGSEILTDINALTSINLAINSFSCLELKNLDTALKRRGVTLEHGYSKKAGNYNGMTCTT